MTATPVISTLVDYKKDPRFSFLYESGLTGVVFTHIDGEKIIRHEPNEAFLSMIGYDREEVEADPEFLWKITTPNYQQSSLSTLRSLHVQSEFKNYEKEYFHKNGTVVHVIGSTYRIDDNVIVAFITDITQQRRIEKQLKATENLFKGFASSGIVGINFWNTSGKMWGVNQAYTDIHGYTEEDVTSPDFEWSRIPVEGEEHKFISGLEKVLRGETVKPYATRVLHKDGRVIDILVGYALAEGSQTEGICVTLDISREKQMERALQESEERFRFIYESNLVGVSFAVLHDDGSVEREANDAFFEMIGYTKDDFTKDPLLWDKIIVQEDVDKRKQAWENIKSDKRSENVVLRYYRKDGSIATVNVHSTLLKENLATAIILDISDQVEAESALLRSEERFRNMVDQSPTMTFIADEQAQVTYVNTAILQFAGYSFEEMIGSGWTKTVHPDDVAELFENWMYAVQHESDYAVCFRMRDASGNYRNIEAISKPMYYNKKLQGYIGVLVDMTDQLKAEMAIQELLRKKDEFLSIASHELKTPLTGLKAATQLLSEFVRNGEYDLLPQYLAKANKQLDRLVRLIDELLDVSKIDAGKMNVHLESFMATELLETAKEYLHAANRNYVVHADDIDFEIKADKGRIEQVIYNFLSNAVKYSSGENTIALELTKRENNLFFSVQDEGVGIPKEKLPFIFERFYRVDESANRAAGLGLGLYISSEIIKRHNGQIDVRSEEQKGSRFTFTIPLRNVGKN